MPRKNKSTKVELVEALKLLNTGGELDNLIREAKEGQFHDHENTKYEAPKLELVTRLKAYPYLNRIRAEVLTGVYDEPYEESAEMPEGVEKHLTFEDCTPSDLLAMPLHSRITSKTALVQIRRTLGGWIYTTVAIHNHNPEELDIGVGEIAGLSSVFVPEPAKPANPVYVDPKQIIH